MPRNAPKIIPSEHGYECLMDHAPHPRFPGQCVVTCAVVNAYTSPTAVAVVDVADVVDAERLIRRTKNIADFWELVHDTCGTFDDFEDPDNVDEEHETEEHGEPVPTEHLQPDNLLMAIRHLRSDLDPESDRYLACTALMRSLEIGPMHAVADALVTQFQSVIEFENDA